MPIKFPSDAWGKALMEEVNKSVAYAEAAKNWEGDFYFVVLPQGELKEPAYLYMNLFHGKCLEAGLVSNQDQKDPAFRMMAPAATWKKVIEKKLNPIQGLLTRQLQLKGDMTMIMKNVKAAQELVECTTRIQTEFPKGI
ncbi:MAG: SCP2 sterol-binding domain-containing protein [Chloroflexi bacterium]|nr:SCP2 sterol-binding domain-containing protein [Chloroflexota bacterium]